MDNAIKCISLISNIFTILTSAIAIYLFVYKRKTITSIFDLLINYSFQLTLSEIKEKIERLNEYNVKDQEQCEKIVNILNEIIGQIRGNSKLKPLFSELLNKLEILVTNKKKLTEPSKRALVVKQRLKLTRLSA